MYKHSFLILLILQIACHAPEKEAAYQMPADWQPQQGVFVNYSGPDRVDSTTLKVHQVCMEMIRELSAVTKVWVQTNEEINQDSLRQLFASKGIHMDNTMLVPVYKLFTTGVPRDYGPMVIKDRQGNNKLLRFHWDYVGADFVSPDSAWVARRDTIRSRYYRQMSELLGWEVVKSPIAIEGGEIEINGRGTALLVDSFTHRRNPGITEQAFAKELARTLDIQKIIWLREGVVEDPAPGRKAKIGHNTYGFGVGGHVDEFARFANANTVLLAMPSAAEADRDSLKKANYRRMQLNYEILQNSTDQDGAPLKIVLFPVPDVIPDTFVVEKEQKGFPVSVLMQGFPEWKQGDTILFMPAVSYLNYFLINELLLIPKYWKPGFPESCRQKDEQAKQLFARHFPGKKIVQIDPWGLNYVGGGMHCWTQQVPK